MRARRIALMMVGATTLLLSATARGEDEGTVPNDIYYSRWMSRSVDLKISVGASMVFGTRVMSNYPTASVEVQACYKLNERFSVGLQNLVLFNMVDEFYYSQTREGFLVQNLLAPNIRIHFQGRNHELWVRLGLAYSFFQLHYLDG